MSDPVRPKVDFTQKERSAELAMLNDLRIAKRFANVYPKRLDEARQNLADLYTLVIIRYRTEK